MNLCFREWEQQQLWPNRKIVSFDFDGVLHTDVRGFHPTSHYEVQLTPHKRMHKKLHEESQDHQIIICSKRSEWSRNIVERFVKHHQLPVEEIYLTNDQPKDKVLLSVGAIRHYDDNPVIGQELEGTGIEFILVK